MRKLLVFILSLFVLSLLHQSAYAQIPLAGFIKTLGNADTYPTHMDSLGKGGYRIVANKTERDAISNLRRKIGMLVYVQDVDSLYMLKGDTTNKSWTIYSSANGAVAAVGSATSASTANTIVQRDGSSSFAAGTITAALNGNAATATFAPTAGTLNQPSQTEITTVGPLLGLTVLSDIVGNITGNAVTATTANSANTALTATNVSGTVAIANGGTGTNNVLAAKTNFGLEKVDNIPDSLKSVSIPVKTALALKENTNNKNTNTALGNSDTYFPTQNAVRAYVDGKVASGAPDATQSVKGKVRLNGDITGTADSVLIASVGGRSATDIGIATGLAILATNDGTGSTLVKRNPSGDFSAGMITANLTGTASLAGYAANAGNALTAGTAGNVTGIVILGNGGTGATTAADARVNLGIGNVNNTSDIDKPVSTADSLALLDKISYSKIGVSGGVASLGADGKVPTDEIPPMSFTTVQLVNDSLSMINLKAANGIDPPLVGSVVIRKDNSKNYVLGALPATTFGNWVELLSTGSSSVQSVNNKIGTVVLTAADLGLPNVQNTADIDKVVSTLTLAQLNLKEVISNKSTIATLGINDLLYPSQHAVKTYVDSSVIKGTKDATTIATGKMQLAGDLAGIASAPTVARVGGASAVNIASATAAANLANSSMVGGTIVKRDVSGNFAAGTITANLFNGNATSATTATTALTAGTATTVSGIVDVLNGGTGASDIINARANLGLGNVDNTADVDKPLSNADIAALLLKVNADLVAQPNGLATLGADGKVPTTQIPAMSFTTVQVVGDSASMVNLSGNVLIGSVVIRTDNNKNYVLAAIPATDINNWVELRSTGGSNVQSVAGKIGNVTLLKSDVGLGNVDNTTDANKPVSTATATALLAKENSSNKSTSGTLGTDDVLYPTQHAVKTYVDNKVATGVADATTGATGKIQLAGDLGGTGTTATSPKIASVGGISAANIASATTLTMAATDQNTVGTIVKRDGSGNFTGTLIGNATNVTGMVLPANGGTGVATTTKAYVFAGPTLTDGVPAFRPLIATDFPDLSGTYLPLAGGNLSGALTGTSAAFTSASVTGALTAGTINSLTLSPSSIGFTVAGGTTPKTLTVTDNTTLAGSNSGDVTLAGQNYLTLGTGATGQQITAGLVDVSTQIKGILAATAFPALLGDVTSTAGLLTTTIAPNAVTTGKIQDGSVTLAKMGNISANKLLGNASGGPAAVTEIILGNGLSFSGATLNATNAGAVTSITGVADRISINNTTTVPGIDIASTYIGQNTITTLGTIIHGVWKSQDGAIGSAYGGTGFNNDTSTIKLSGNLLTIGGNPITLTTTGITGLTLPVTGTLATLAGSEVLTNKTIDGSLNTIKKIDAGQLTNTLLEATFPALRGDITTGIGSLATLISPNVVSNDKLALMPTLTLKGNNMGSTAAVADLSITAVRAMLGLGASGSNSGDITLGVGENYLSLAAGQIVTAKPIDLSTTNVTNTLPVSKGGTGVIIATQNTFFAGPATGTGSSTGTPGFRTLVPGDLPGGSNSYIANNGTVTAQPASAFNISGNGLIGGTLGVTGLTTLASLSAGATTLAATTATSVNKVTITAPTTAATLTLVDGSSLITAGAFATTLTSTAATNVTLPVSGTLATLGNAETITGVKTFNNSTIAMNGPLTGTITLSAANTAGTAYTVALPAKAGTVALISDITTATGTTWGLTGNAATTPGTNFIGTTDDKDVIFKRKNVQSGLLNFALFNTSWGVNALNPATTGNYNNAYGVNSLATNTTGIDNSAYGVNSLGTNTTGSWNSAYGGSSLAINTTGNYNSAYGFLSLAANTTGNYNNAYGANSLLANTTGYYNNAYGVNSLLANTTGYYNSAYGNYSLGANTTGYYNSAYGFQSLSTNSTGNYNNAYGASSLLANTTGYYNNAYGNNSLGANTTGYNNTAMGTNAGFGDGATINQQSTIDYNALFLGYQASRDGVANTTALTNITAIGYLAKVTQSNSMILGATGANAVSVGIGNTAPVASAVLDITSTSKGVLLPRMTTVQKAAIASPAIGLTVYDSTLNQLQVYNGTSWGLIATVSGILPIANGGTGTAVNATQNFVFAGPATGTVAGAPAFRAMVAADLPGGSNSYIANNGTITPQANSAFNISGAGVIGGTLTAGATTLGATTATALDKTPIGVSTQSTGAFTTLTANAAAVFFNTFNAQKVTSITDTTSSTTSANGALVVTGGAGIAKNLNVGGAIIATANITAFSDIRLKKNIHTLAPVSASLRKIDAVEFDRKDIQSHQIGFIAQNVQKYFPSLVSVAKDSMATLSLNYQSMTSPLLKGWQEHDELITKQQKEIDLLKKEVELLKQSQLELIKLIKSKK